MCTIPLYPVATATTTSSDLLSFMHSLNREKRMMWLNCIILYADIGLSDDDNDRSGERQHVLQFFTALPCCVCVCAAIITQVYGVEIGRLFCYTPRYI